MPRRRGPDGAGGLLLFNANVSARRTPRWSPAPIARHHPICAKLSMIEWHEIENPAFSSPLLSPRRHSFSSPFFLFRLLFASSSSPKSDGDFLPFISLTNEYLRIASSILTHLGIYTSKSFRHVSIYFDRYLRLGTFIYLLTLNLSGNDYSILDNLTT